MISNSLHKNINPYDNKLISINKEWLEWFVGFTDAEGSFSIVEIKNNNFKFLFRIRLHKDDINVLHHTLLIINFFPKKEFLQKIIIIIHNLIKSYIQCLL